MEPQLVDAAGQPESALLIVCPAAEPVVADHRSRYDAAARVGVPAHVTVGYPFKPLAAFTDADHQHLTALFADAPCFELTFSGVGWFGDEVLYLRPDNAAPVVDVTRAVGDAFPEYPIYRGAFDQVVPHLTIGHDAPSQELTVIEGVIAPKLPVTQAVSSIELWVGPALESGKGSWRRVLSYPLGRLERSTSGRGPDDDH